MKSSYSREMIEEQLPLLAHNLPPLALRDRVRTPEGWIGEIAQVWPGRDWHAVFAWEWVGSAPVCIPPHWYIYAQHSARGVGGIIALPS